MTAFAVFSLPDGRKCALRVDRILRVVEPDKATATRASLSGCVSVISDEPESDGCPFSETWVCGDVEGALRIIARAEIEGSVS